MLYLQPPVGHLLCDAEVPVCERVPHPELEAAVAHLVEVVPGLEEVVGDVAAREVVEDVVGGHLQSGRGGGTGSVGRTLLGA